MSFAPTKSICRTGVGQLRHRHLNELKLRGRLFSDSVTARKSRNLNPRLSSNSGMYQLNSQRSSTFTTIANRNRSSVASISTESNRPKDEKSTAAITTMAVAAAALLLGGTFQLEHRRISRERQKKKEDISTSEHGSEKTLSGNNQHYQEIEKLTKNHPDLLDYLLDGIQFSSSHALVSQMEPLRRQEVKNPISAQFHQPRNVMISRMRSIKGRGLNEKYNVEWNTVLGEGAYGSVHPARLALTGEKVALKKISKRYTNSSDFFMETDALLRIYDNGGHPNISGLRDMYEDYKHYYLVMDLITGGELFDHLSNDGAYSEADAARLIFEISSALAFMHGVGVIHCDIKPENLMLCSRKRRGGTIKIIDFGCAITQPVGHFDAGVSSDGIGKASDVVETGTTGYWPPERFKGHKLTPAVDTWALGIILYIMLMGFHPFDINCDRSDEEVADAIKANPLPPMDDVYVGHLSDSAKDLIRRLMEPDPTKRMSAYELLHHPWVQGETATTEKIEDSDKRLSKFQDLRYKLEASVFAVLVNQGHPTLTMSEAKRRNTATPNGSSGVSIMKSVFDVFDEDGKGYVTGEDIGKVVAEHTGEVVKTHDANEFLKAGNQVSELSLSNFSNLFPGMKHKHYPVSI